MRICKQCNGFKHTNLGGYVADGKALRERVANCAACRGEGIFHDFDRVAILRRIMENQGRNKGQVRSKMESPNLDANIVDIRAYYVWHMIKYQAKADRKLPVVIAFGIKADAYRDDLNEMAETVALALSWDTKTKEISAQVS